MHPLPYARMDPAQRPRLVAIIDNLRARIAEARTNGWLGEVQALQVSLDAARGKLTNLDRLSSTGPTNLGIPTLRGSDRDPATRS